MSPDPKKEDIESKYDEIGTTDRKVALENSNEIVENIEDNVEFGERKDESIDKGYTDYDIKDKKTYESKSIEQKQPQSSHRRGIPSHPAACNHRRENPGAFTPYRSPRAGDSPLASRTSRRLRFPGWNLG